MNTKKLSIITLTLTFFCFQSAFSMKQETLSKQNQIEKIKNMQRALQLFDETTGLVDYYDRINSKEWEDIREKKDIDAAIIYLEQQKEEANLQLKKQLTQVEQERNHLETKFNELKDLQKKATLPLLPTNRQEDIQKTLQEEIPTDLVDILPLLEKSFEIKKNPINRLKEKYEKSSNSVDQAIDKYQVYEKEKPDYIDILGTLKKNLDNILLKRKDNRITEEIKHLNDIVTETNDTKIYDVLQKRNDKKFQHALLFTNAESQYAHLPLMLNFTKERVEILYKELKEEEEEEEELEKTLNQLLRERKGLKKKMVILINQSKKYVKTDLQEAVKYQKLAKQVNAILKKNKKEIAKLQTQKNIKDKKE